MTLMCMLMLLLRLTCDGFWLLSGREGMTAWRPQLRTTTQSLSGRQRSSLFCLQSL